MSKENGIPICRRDDGCMNDATFITSDTHCPMCDGCKAIAQDENDDHDDPRYVPIEEFNGHVPYVGYIRDGVIISR